MKIRLSIFLLAVMIKLFFYAGHASAARESMLYPAGPAAEKIAGLWWEMLIVYGIVFLITMIFLVVALVVRRREHPVLGSRFVIISGIGIPVIILAVMLFSTIQATVEMGKVPADYHIEVNSHHWWFEVRYPENGIVDANEIHIPVGKMVEFKLLSKGVVHSFWVPRLAGKRDMLPDHPTTLRLMADQAGVYRGTCTEYCAGPHALMAFRLIAHEPDDFEQWVSHNNKIPPVPTNPQLLQGRRVFEEGGCAACHAISGVSKSDTGPDLTRLASRRTLGAGTIANTKGNLSGWIADPQSIKPRNMMPPSYLPPGDLHALVEYLRSLQ
ncbi:MAG: cytochrome c oxidase subunit II [Desulforhopalus sp.]